jgi:homoserine kinase
MANQSVLIRVPATVGNFAGAASCAALALDASLNVKATPRMDGQIGIRYFGPNGERVPRDRSNLIVRSMEAALHLRELEFTGADFEVYSSVPVAVGLGSSTAAILAGLLAADRLFRLGIDEKTVFDLATIFESRSDNLHAAWAGGFAACADGEPSPTYRRIAVPPHLALHVVVPETTLALAAPRERPVDRVKDLSANFHRAALVAEYFARPGKGPSPDLETPLPPTCEKAVAGLDEALQVRCPGLASVFVCGSGPAIGILALEQAGEAVRGVQEVFERYGVASTPVAFLPSNAGAREWNAVRPEVVWPPMRAQATTAHSPGNKSTCIPV